MVNGDPELLRIFPGGAQSPVHPCTFLGGGVSDGGYESHYSVFMKNKDKSMIPV